MHFTGSGGTLVREVYPQVVEVLVEKFSALSAREQEQLAALCRRLGTA